MNLTVASENAYIEKGCKFFEAVEVARIMVKVKDGPESISLHLHLSASSRDRALFSIPILV